MSTITSDDESSISHLLSFRPEEVHSEIIIVKTFDVSNLTLSDEKGHQVLDLDSPASASGGYVMSPDSGYGGDDNRRTPTASSSYLTVVEQPENSYRFRYKKESQKPHGPLKGRNSIGKTQKNSNGPQVKLENFEGEAMIRVWLHCQTEDEGPSPHRLVTVVGKDKIKDEPHDLVVNKSNNYTACFNKLNILHVVTNDKPYQKCYLRKKRSLGKNGSLFIPNPPIFNGEVDERQIKAEWKSKNKDICSLLFEAYEKQGTEYVFIGSCLSQPIKNKKSPKTNGLRIVKSSHVQGTCLGGTEVLIFTEKLIKEVRIIFFDDEGWHKDAEFKESDIHKQVGVAFRTPPYKNFDITEEVLVKFKIHRTTDEEESEPYTFRYQPREDNLFFMLEQPAKRKKPQITRNDPMLSDTLLEDNSMDMQTLLGTNDSDNFMDGDPLSLENDVSTDDLLHDALPNIALYQNFSKDSIQIQMGPEIKSEDPVKEAESLAEKARRLQISIVQSDIATFSQLIKTANIATYKYANQTPLHLAVKQQQPLIVCELLKAGANVYSLDNNGSNTALHLAIQSSSQTCLQLLLRAVKPQAVFNKDGDDPVLFATRNSFKGALELLLMKGFLPATENIKNGDTPLHVAVENCIENGQTEIVDLLLKYGASASEYNYAGKTPLHYAVAAQNDKLVDKLLPYCDADDYEDDEDELSSRLNLLELATEPTIKSNLESFLSQTDDEREPENPGETEEPFLALDGDVELSKKVATRLGCAFLIPFLVNAEKQSQVLLNHLQRKNGMDAAVSLLNDALAMELSDQ